LYSKRKRERERERERERVSGRGVEGKKKHGFFKWQIERMRFVENVERCCSRSIERQNVPFSVSGI
jgi:hypothetical protein